LVTRSAGEIPTLPVTWAAVMPAVFENAPSALAEIAVA